jgi:putative RNA 2'-phosphotransferase
MKKLTHISKYLSLILRHKPESINLNIDEHGWAYVDELIQKTTKYDLTRDIIEEVVAKNDKKRFILSEDGLKIKAQQGHSIKVILQLEAIKPPDVLFHGTPIKSLSSILNTGIKKMSRHHVHLSDNINTAVDVAERRGKAAVTLIDAKAMFEDGINFYKTGNDVWLVDFVDKKYIRTDEKKCPECQELV